MAPPRLIARHLADPRGLFGRFVGGLMNRHNARMNGFALEGLEAGPQDQVLEIGFGGGATLAPLLARAAHLTGVDRSADMVKQATARHHAEVAAGRAYFQVGTIEALPFDSERFDRVLSVNTVYFWTALADGATEVRRVLKKGGRLALGFLPGDAMERLAYPKDIFTFRSVDSVSDALSQAGFDTVEVRRPAASAWVVLVAG